MRQNLADPVYCVAKPCAIRKPEAIVWTPAAIDTPGEYLENRCLYSALLTSACEADVIALVLNADAPSVTFFLRVYRPDEPPGHRGDH